MTNFSKFLTSHTSQFYVNALSGKRPKSLQNAKGYTDKMFSRKDNGFAHFVVRYFEGTDFKDFGEVKYYYIVQQDIKDNKFKVRDDLIPYFRNARNLYILLLTDQWACEIKSTEFFISKDSGRYHQVVYETSCMNTDLNWIHVFSINTKYARKVDLTKVEEDKELTEYLNKSVSFIEKVAYARYRNRKESRGILVTNTVTGKVTPFKSVKQCYDLFVKPSQLMGYRKFRDSTKQNQIKVVYNNTEYLVESIPCNNTESKDESALCAL